MQSDFASTFAHSGEVQFLESREGCTNDSLSSPNYSLPSSEHEGSSHSSSDLLIDLCEDGGQLVSTGFQTDWCNTIWARCFLSLLFPEDRAHIVFADLMCRCVCVCVCACVCGGGCWRG